MGIEKCPFYKSIDGRVVVCGRYKLYLCQYCKDGQFDWITSEEIKKALKLGNKKREEYKSEEDS